MLRCTRARCQLFVSLCGFGLSAAILHANVAHGLTAVCVVYWSYTIHLYSCVMFEVTGTAVQKTLRCVCIFLAAEVDVSSAYLSHGVGLDGINSVAWELANMS